MISVPDVEGVQRLLLAETDRARSIIASILRGDLPVQFRWLESELWIDRARMLVLEVGEATSELRDQFRGCRRCSDSAWDMVEFLKAIVLGRGRELRSGADCAIFLNYTVMQPLVNPAFGPLDLHVELDNRRAAELNLGVQLGPMAFDLSRYPESRSEASAVREAQVRFVKTYFEPQLDARHLASKGTPMSHAHTDHTCTCATVRAAATGSR